MVWDDDAASVLGVADAAALIRANAFALLVDAEHASARYDAITAAAQLVPNTSASYRTNYRLLPAGRRVGRSVWVEDSGVCWFGADAKPDRAHGTLGVIDDERELEQHCLRPNAQDEPHLNRTRLTEELAAFLTQSRRAPCKGAFLLVAIDGLTKINVTHGFDIGDEVIVLISRRLGRVLRVKDRIGRFASNRFGILLDHCPAEGIEPGASRLAASVRDHGLDTSAGAIAVTVSIGAVTLPGHAASAETAIAAATQALDTARARGEDAFALFEPTERRESERQRAISTANEIISALNDRRMILALQPIVAARSRLPQFYECLLRLKKLDGSIAAAADFIPVAEQFDLVRLVDHRVLELAIEQLRADPRLALTLNLSAATMSDGKWLRSLEAFTGKDRALTERLTVGISESAARLDLASTVRFVRGLKELGSSAALTNFSGGPAPYRTLKALGADVVKIDGTCIEALGGDGDPAFVRSLIELAKGLGASTVAEWVPDEETARVLESAGIDYMQGYFFGAPELVTPLHALRRPLAEPPAKVIALVPKV
jgi:diguanylate cyclase (GGDEF)-like protein